MGDTYNIEKAKVYGLNEYEIHFVNENTGDVIVSYIQKHALLALLTVAEKESSEIDWK